MKLLISFVLVLRTLTDDMSVRKMSFVFLFHIIFHTNNAKIVIKYCCGLVFFKKMHFRGVHNVHHTEYMILLNTCSCKKAFEIVTDCVCQIVLINLFITLTH